jgi:hypothetical protein
MSNTGVVNTKLPVKNNRICTSEQGCDEIYSGDSVFVDGYDSVQCEGLRDESAQHSGNVS